MPKMTLATVRVLRVLQDHAGDELYGREIGWLSGLPSGTVMPILARLAREGWLEARRENADPAKLGRPVRSYYKLTEVGARESGARLGKEKS
jgi:DNA-binding PadR family transcriptional regulator